MSISPKMEIPFVVKERLLEIAKKLPQSSRSRFLINTSKEFASFAATFAKDHKYSLIYGAIGYLLGHLVDELFVITIPCVGQWRPTQNLAGLILGMTGLGYGFMKDQDVYHLQMIIKREIQAALV